ncbi:hypothetical protein GCM10007304_17660 [Rhodococcoides trifolii]|uniref:Uncharacterized protein n=1 Tax=Rhodococcoides trifolii TaxID=908250 RepID=A0A917CY55_9NOCA|nr:hypothetical protein [Rhodococcus trifolii]GGG03991.1 hypothetical protein GCM10007304_17660 [Rhodococcus trifolii]
MDAAGWMDIGSRLREHAKAHADRLRDETGVPHYVDPGVVQIAVRCETASYSPSVQRPKLEKLAADTLARDPTPQPARGNFDLSSRQADA